MNSSSLRDQVSVVVLTYNRREELLRTLQRMHEPADSAYLTDSADSAAIIVVDNASVDGSAEAVAQRFPQVRVIRLQHNVGAAGRNAGVEAAQTRYVAFCDDDVWWAPGSLARAANVMDAYPRLAAITGRVLVGEDEFEDPTSTEMAASPLDNQLGLPGTTVMGFLAGACMLRRAAFVSVGGYHPRFFLGIEEGVMAMDFMSMDWVMAYLPDVMIHHHPSPRRDASSRRRLILRNALWCAWLRRPADSAWRETTRLLREARHEPKFFYTLMEAILGAPWVLRERRVIPARVEEAMRRVSEAY